QEQSSQRRIQTCLTMAASLAPLRRLRPRRSGRSPIRLVAGEEKSTIDRRCERRAIPSSPIWFPPSLTATRRTLLAAPSAMHCSWLKRLSGVTSKTTQQDLSAADLRLCLDIYANCCALPPTR